MKGRKVGIPTSDFPDDHNVVLLGHELGNVLNGLLGMAELLGDSGLNAEQSRWLRAIEHSGRQMQSLIRTARFPAGETELNIEPSNERSDGVELLEQVLICHWPAARARNNRMLLAVHPDLPRNWYCDPCLVRQLLDNLVGNAIKFTRAGEILIEAKAVPAAGVASDTLELRISDTGKGLGTAADHRIFDAYQRGRPSSGGEPGDRGLGLYVCSSIVRAMNGRISCSSPKAGGASFNIALPQALIFREKCPGILSNSVLSQIRCRLQLGNPLRRVVENFLARLGVRHGTRRSEIPTASGRGLDLVISDAAATADRHHPGLLLTPRSRPGTMLRSRTLEDPVLESSLGLLLLEIALRWRSLSIRNGTQGSVPERR